MRRASINIIAAVAAAATAAAACGPKPIQIDIPFDSDDRAAVIAIQEGDTLEVWAVGDTERQSMPVLRRLENFDPASGMTITVLLYRHTLTEHHLTAGKIERSGEATARALPNEQRILRGTLAPADAIAWAQLADIPEPLASFKIAAEDRCIDLDEKIFSLSGDERYFETAVALDDSTAWVATAPDQYEAPKLYAVSKDGATAIRIPQGLDEMSIQALEKDRDGKMWVAGGTVVNRVPRLFAGVPETGFARVFGRPSEARGDWVNWMQRGTAAEDPTTMYTLTQRGDLERYVNGNWDILFRTDRQTTSGIGGLAVVSPSEVYFILPGGSAIYRYDGSKAERDQTELDQQLDFANEFVKSIAHIPDLGTFAGTESGSFLQRVGDRWTVVDHTPLVLHEIRAIVPFEDGLLLTGRFGFVYQFFDPKHGLCLDTAANFGGEFFVQGLVPLASGWVAAGTREIDSTHNEAIAGFVSLHSVMGNQ